MARKESENREIQLTELAQRVVQPFGLELYDLVFRRLGPRWKLQVFLSRPDGAISLDDCEKVSRQLSRELDVADLVDHAYDMEVSSPGLERPLRHPWHWERVVGQKVTARYLCEDGKKRTITATLESVSEGIARLRDDQNNLIELQIRAVENARLHVDW